jgi:hypothetical protein
MILYWKHKNSDVILKTEVLGRREMRRHIWVLWRKTVEANWVSIEEGEYLIFKMAGYEELSWKTAQESVIEYEA